MMRSRTMRDVFRRLRLTSGSTDSMHEKNRDKAQVVIASGQALEDAGRVSEALERYQDAAALAPGFPVAHLNMGNALRKLGRNSDAVAAYGLAIDSSPNYAAARFNLASLFLETGNLSEAEREMLEALRLEPGMTEARVVLADIFEQTERFEDAEREFLQALREAPHHAGILLNFGMFCLRLGRVQDGLGLLQRARHADPLLEGVDSAILFSLNFSTDTPLDQIAKEHFRFGSACLQRVGAPFIRWKNLPVPDRRLRIGYVSGDFGPHPIATFIRPVLEKHDRAAFEIFCYSNLPKRTPVTQTLSQCADAWREIHVLSDDGVIQLVEHDSIDILIDLSGHTARERLHVFAKHPAPVQLTWLGYLNTTGLLTMDYRITDAHTDPPGETEHLHSEKLLRLPDSQWCYRAWHEVPLVIEPHAGRPEALVFGSFNQAAKITSRTMSLWARVLSAMPKAELIVFDVRQESNRTRIGAALQDLGVDPTRLTFCPRRPVTQYLAAIGNVDIALDTYPYNGATTTLDAAWMGVPTVALKGDRGISRSSYSIMRTLAADNLIAHTDEEYVELNRALAQDRSWRVELRKTLRDRLKASPLMDATGFTRALERCYRDVWQEWCASHAGPKTLSNAAPVSNRTDRIS